MKKLHEYWADLLFGRMSASLGLQATKRLLPSSTQIGDRNINRVEPIDHAAWLWHPDVEVDTPAFLRFRCCFQSDGSDLRLHLTADQHYVLFIDGHRIARGPDRSDVEHWSFSSYNVKLDPGDHEIQVAVWWLGDHAPMCMMTHRGGFALHAEGVYEPLVTTGQGPWDVTEHRGWTLRPSEFVEIYHVIGDSLHIDAASWDEAYNHWKKPSVIRRPVLENDTGLDMMGGWKCYPSRLPAFMDYRVCKGKIRAIIEDYQGGVTILHRHIQHSTKAEWQALLDKKEAVTVPAHTHIAVLWDFENYYCGYHEIEMTGGKGSTLECRWAESLFEKDGLHKGNRSEILGKQYVGFGDGYTTDGGERRWIPYWVCSGRYMLIEIQTGDEPLRIENICINEVRYPLEMEARIDTGSEDLQSIIPLCLRVLQCCSHDHYVDCPYYEQMMYVGDARLEMLATSVLTEDSRLQERSISLFDYSRRAFGFVAERYTAREDQQSVTFAAIWVLCVRDFALWRDKPAFVRDRMRGVRANLDCFLPYRNKKGLVENLPGWSFIDWVKEWNLGYAPGHWTGCCGPTNLFYLLSLQAAVELETMLGSPHLAAYYQELAEQTEAAIQKTFWNPERKAFADDKEQKFYSQHSQCLAVIAGLVDKKDLSALMRQTLTAGDMAEASIYFRHYLFEALYRAGEGEELLAQYQPWVDLLQLGLFTTVERFEPTRSDCHAWGSHALYHMVASLAGIRPASASFKKIRIQPSQINLPHLRMQIPHPSGVVELDLKRTDDQWHGVIALPKGCSGQFVDGPFKLACKSGETQIPKRYL